MITTQACSSLSIACPHQFAGNNSFDILPHWRHPSRSQAGSLKQAPSSRLERQLKVSGRCKQWVKGSIGGVDCTFAWCMESLTRLVYLHCAVVLSIVSPKRQDQTQGWQTAEGEAFAGGGSRGLSLCQRLPLQIRGLYEWGAPQPGQIERYEVSASRTVIASAYNVPLAIQDITSMPCRVSGSLCCLEKGDACNIWEDPAGGCALLPAESFKQNVNAETLGLGLLHGEASLVRGIVGAQIAPRQARQQQMLVICFTLPALLNWMQVRAP